MLLLKSGFAWFLKSDFIPLKSDITQHKSDFRKAGESDFRIPKSDFPGAQSDFSRTEKPNFTNHKKVKSDFPNGKIPLQ